MKTRPHIRISRVWDVPDVALNRTKAIFADKQQQVYKLAVRWVIIASKTSDSAAE